MVIRTEGGAGRAIAAHHSQSLESLWTHFPGIYVVMPSTPYDAKGLMKAAIRDDNPVLFFEHMYLYHGIRGAVPEEDYTVPIGVAEVKRPGNDVTVVAAALMMHRAMNVAKELSKEGIEVEIVDPRTLAPLDEETILASLKKTGRLVVVHEGWKTGSVSGEISARIAEDGFRYLRGDYPARGPAHALSIRHALSESLCPR